MKMNERQKRIIDEYERMFRNRGCVNYEKITKAVGLHSNNSKYVRRTIQLWKQEQESKGNLIPCLGDCGQMFMSEGKHNRLCNDCRQEGEAYEPHHFQTRQSKSIYNDTIYDPHSTRNGPYIPDYVKPDMSIYTNSGAL